MTRGKVRCPICSTAHRLHIARIHIADTLDHVEFECRACWRNVNQPADTGHIARLAAAGAPINLHAPNDPRTLLA